MPGVAVITFDLDETLWDVEPALRRAEQAQTDWLQQHRPHSLSLDKEALRALKENLWHECAPYLYDVSRIRREFLYRWQLQAGYSEDDSHSGAEAAFSAFLTARQQVELYPQALPVLQELHKTYTLGALTNGNADIYKTPAGPLFSFAFLAEQVGAAKPDSALFEAATKVSKVEPQQIVHVGDNPHHDVQGAQRAGLRSVWVNFSGEAWPGGQRAEAEINNLRQLPEVIASLAAAS